MPVIGFMSSGSAAPCGPLRCRVPRRPESNCLRRRPERRHRFPLGGRSIRSTADDCCRTCSPEGGRHCRGRGRTCGSSGCGSHAHDPYCIQHRWRSDQARHRAKSQPTSWQRDRRVPFCCGYRGKAAGASVRSGSDLCPHRRALEPEQCQRRNPVKRRSGGSTRHRSENSDRARWHRSGSRHDLHDA